MYLKLGREAFNGSFVTIGNIFGDFVLEIKINSG